LILSLSLGPKATVLIDPLSLLGPKESVLIDPLSLSLGPKASVFIDPLSHLALKEGSYSILTFSSGPKERVQGYNLKPKIRGYNKIKESPTTG